MWGMGLTAGKTALDIFKQIVESSYLEVWFFRSHVTYNESKSRQKYLPGKKKIRLYSKEGGKIDLFVQKRIMSYYCKPNSSGSSTYSSSWFPAAIRNSLWQPALQLRANLQGRVLFSKFNQDKTSIFTNWYIAFVERLFKSLPLSVLSLTQVNELFSMLIKHT